jgi:predicted GIY-YIG superfamily endonuclease
VFSLHSAHIFNRLYIGVTENLDDRIAAYNGGKGAEWTRTHHGAHLPYSEPHLTLGSARKRELQLKKWSRAKKGSTQNLPLLKALSRCKSTLERTER